MKNRIINYLLETGVCDSRGLVPRILDAAERLGVVVDFDDINDIIRSVRSGTLHQTTVYNKTTYAPMGETISLRELYRLAQHQYPSYNTIVNETINCVNCRGRVPGCNAGGGVCRHNIQNYQSCQPYQNVAPGFVNIGGLNFKLDMGCEYPNMTTHAMQWMLDKMGKSNLTPEQFNQLLFYKPEGDSLTIKIAGGQGGGNQNQKQDNQQKKENNNGDNQQKQEQQKQDKQQQTNQKQGGVVITISDLVFKKGNQ